MHSGNLTWTLDAGTFQFHVQRFHPGKWEPYGIFGLEVMWLDT